VPRGAKILCDLIQFLEYGVLSQIFPKLITGFLLASADVILPRFAVESQGSFMGEARRPDGLLFDSLVATCSSSCGQYTPVNRGGLQREIALLSICIIVNYIWQDAS